MCVNPQARAASLIDVYAAARNNAARLRVSRRLLMKVRGVVPYTCLNPYSSVRWATPQWRDSSFKVMGAGKRFSTSRHADTTAETRGALAARSCGKTLAEVIARRRCFVRASALPLSCCSACLIW